MRSLAALVTSAALAVSIPAMAGAAIEPQVGIAGIELGMTASEVIAEKGEPDKERAFTNELVGPVRMLRYGQTKAFVWDDTDIVHLVQTRGRAQRTARGAGIGSTEERILDVVPNVRCRTESGFHSCFVGRRRPGKTVTSFFFSRRTDRVNRVVVGYVLD